MPTAYVTALAISPAYGASQTVYAAARANTYSACLLYTSDAADERSSVDLGGRRIIKKKNILESRGSRHTKSIIHQTRNDYSIRIYTWV